jgi:hypothetical protein
LPVKRDGNGATLVTSNANEFARVVGLKWEDWPFLAADLHDPGVSIAAGNPGTPRAATDCQSFVSRNDQPIVW